MITVTNSCQLPLLTIAIPTWNRDRYLLQNLRQLTAEIDKIGHSLVEVLVSDNCSSDSTGEVVLEARAAGLPVRYIKNEKNLGWARNFAQCFELAVGKYVLLFGDDDVLCSGALPLLISHLINEDHGVICLRPYGYEVDYVKEYPGANGNVFKFTDASEFLVSISKCFTLTSALVINRSLLGSVDSRQFIHTNLATFHLVLRAALAAKSNVYINKFLVASKRQNSSNYEYYKVFVDEFWEIIDSHVAYGLKPWALARLETQRLFAYYPFYMLDIRASGRGDIESTFSSLKLRFGKRLLFWVWIAPTLRFPRPIALIWGAITMTIGRIANGDLKRGLIFLRNRLL